MAGTRCSARVTAPLLFHAGLRPAQRFRAPVNYPAVTSLCARRVLLVAALLPLLASAARAQSLQAALQEFIDEEAVIGWMDFMSNVGLGLYSILVPDMPVHASPSIHASTT